MTARALIFLVLVLVPGCAYLSDRLQDAGHCVLMDVQFGGGLSAAAKAGPTALGVGGSWGVYTYGKATWWSGFARFSHNTGGVPFTLVSFPPHTYLAARLPTPEGKTHSRHLAVLGVVTLVESGYPDDKLTDTQVLVDYFGFEAGVFVGVVGAHMGFNLAEFGDFVTGWIGLDILGDDRHRPKAKEPSELEKLNRDVEETCSALEENDLANVRPLVRATRRRVRSLSAEGSVSPWAHTTSDAFSKVSVRDAMQLRMRCIDAVIEDARATGLERVELANWFKGGYWGSFGEWERSVRSTKGSNPVAVPCFAEFVVFQAMPAWLVGVSWEVGDARESRLSRVTLFVVDPTSGKTHAIHRDPRSAQQEARGRS